MHASGLASGLLGLAIASAAWASSGHSDGHDHGHDHGDERRQGQVHVHGLSTLNLVLEGRELAVELFGPANNFIGFEHQPRTDEQRSLLDQALARLADPATLMELPAAAACTLIQTEVTPPDFDAAHAHTGADDHQHGHDHGHEHEQGVHSDIAASWLFECSTPAQLASLPVHVFRHFPLTEEIQANLITPEGQTRQVLSAERSTLRLPR